MQAISKMQVLIMGMNYLMTNMKNMHTLSTCSVHLVTTLVPIMKREIIEFPSNVVSSPGIAVPVIVHIISVHLLLIITIFLKTPSTIFGR
jgi:hypothetical protein